MRTVHYRSLIALLAISACKATPEDVNDTHLLGSVVIPAASTTEKLLANESPAQAQAIDSLTYQVDVIDGTTKGWATTTDGSTADADDDWYAFDVSTAYDGSAHVFVGDGAPEAGPPALPLPLPDTAVPDTDTDTDTDVPVDTAVADTSDTAGGPSGPMIHVSIADLTDAKHPVVLFETDVVDSADLAFSAEPGIPYGLHVEGVVGAGEVPYRVALPGANPDDAGIKVGAFQSSDPKALGFPVGGTSPSGFAPQADWSYSADYDMVFIKALTETAEPDNGDTDSLPQTVTLVNEDVAEVWVFAANWSSLNAGIRSGTWYSGTPAHVALGGPGARAVDTLTLDSIASALEGVTFTDSEPNDVDMDAWDLTGAQDIGPMSDAGYVDHVEGDITWTGMDAGTGVHDIDAYKFQVAATTTMFGQLSWTDGSDVDWYLVLDDPNADFIDGSATYDNPEVGAGADLEPGVDYYLLIVGYQAQDAASPAHYRFDLEWATP